MTHFKSLDSMLEWILKEYSTEDFSMELIKRLSNTINHGYTLSKDDYTDEVVYDLPAETRLEFLLEVWKSLRKEIDDVAEEIEEKELIHNLMREIRDYGKDITD